MHGRSLFHSTIFLLRCFLEPITFLKDVWLKGLVPALKDASLKAKPVSSLELTFMYTPKIQGYR